MTPKQEKFIQEYLVDGCGAQAAIRAGYSKQRAKMSAYENLQKPYIAAEIKSRFDKIARKSETTVQRVLEELASIAFSQTAKASDKLRALELIGRHRAMFTDRLQHSGHIQVTAVERIIVDSPQRAH